MRELAARVLSGEVRAAARACRIVDDRVPGYESLLRALYPGTGRAWVLGVTGNPGAGKSTLVDRLIVALREREQRVAVVAIDPTSPFSGGAILGDRIRMQRHFEDPGVFIRSLGTRGALGGLSRSAADVVRVLDAWGADVVVVETVGVGQDEIEITRAAHTTLVVVAPGLGDEIQAIKAGILECADVFAVNKADREGADATVRDLELMIALGGETLAAVARGRGHSAASPRLLREALVEQAARGVRTPPILKCVATRGEGVTEVLEALEGHRLWVWGSEEGRARWRRRQEEQLRGQLRERLLEAALGELGDELHVVAERVAAREVDPWTAADALVARFRGR